MLARVGYTVPAFHPRGEALWVACSAVRRKFPCMRSDLLVAVGCEKVAQLGICAKNRHSRGQWQVLTGEDSCECESFYRPPL